MREKVKRGVTGRKRVGEKEKREHDQRKNRKFYFFSFFGQDAKIQEISKYQKQINEMKVKNMINEIMK